MRGTARTRGVRGDARSTRPFEKGLAKTLKLWTFFSDTPTETLGGEKEPSTVAETVYIKNAEKLSMKASPIWARLSCFGDALCAVKL